MTEARTQEVSFGYEILLARDFDNVLAGTGTAVGPDELLDKLLASGRLLIQGRGGAGKTHTARAILEIARQRGLGTVFIRSWNLRDLDANRSLTLSDLLEVASEVDSYGRVLDGHGVIVIDGLNEVPRATSDWLLAEIPYLLASTLGLAFLATDRLTRRPAATLWTLATLGLVPSEVIRRLVVQDSGALAEHLRVPYYLNQAIAQGVERSRGEAIEEFLSVHGGLAEGAIEALAEVAYEAYRSSRDRVVDLEALRAGIGSEQVSSLIDAGVLVASESCRFAHQLVHDYLAARHLAANPDAWGEGGFDVVTLDANSFDSLGLVLTLLDDAVVDEFVHRIYDWNLYGAADVLEQDSVGPRRVSANMRLVLLAMLAEKQFDRMRPTAQRAVDSLMLQRDEVADEMLSATSRDDLVALVSRSISWTSPADWLSEWFAMFGRADGEVAEQREIDALGSEFAAIGWAASNALRRAALNTSQLQHLSGLATGTAGEVVRWRAVHVLGASGDPDVRESLFAVLDRADGSKWVRYGALRSLLEIASRSEDWVMAEVLARLGEPARAREIASTPYLHREALNGLDLVDPPAIWLHAAEGLLGELWRHDEGVGSGHRVVELAERIRAASKKEFG
ncbi:hypothetical protein [Cellulomonas sp. KRMCY2]|uniref:hypothetical protein n=1 Tax=Cellulomonas sp. KRMCY2 TaxID=1304865 RepID=UPI00045EAAA8|nr:hypothetical protein [Cellulomonas sp. KRMCY2]